MTASTAFFSSILNIPTSKISNSHLSFNHIQKKQSFFAPSIPISISCNSTAISNSLTLDHDEEVKRAESILGSKVRVKVPLKVYHVPKVPEVDLTGRVGLLKQYVGVHKGKRISANLPYKVEFVAEEISGRGGKPIKFLAHLREDEFEFLD
ncbi:ferredoxin-thioredoxin reductase, variable chain-like [Salvia hispanica]|uniref:ferredoxin-thioredoxin reductase, variable chain-like n=1 Tax=Salvia hispanica TaxID=49212 RepID=UPI0020097FEE|nr:ferredoxin-thioredoxin reductase, variable chain-like [Salvia hispanica]